MATEIGMRESGRVGSCTPGRFWFWTNHSLSALTFRASLMVVQVFGCHFLFFPSYEEMWNLPSRSSFRDIVPWASSVGMARERSLHFPCAVTLWDVLHG